MGDKIINELLTLYDEYMDTLRHISGFNLDVEEFNRINGFSSIQDTDKYLNEGVSDFHSQLINEFIRRMLGLINLSDVRNLKTYIYYPDFKVKTYINNPANLYTKNSSIEKALIISPIYELNLVSRDDLYRGNAFVLRIKRLALSPKINVFSCIRDTVDNYILKCIEKDLINKYKERFGVVPNKDDLVLLRSLAIKYIFEKIKTDHENGLDVLYQGGSFVSYDYKETKKKICDEHNVTFNDSYFSKSNINNPWIFRELVSFDNREVIQTQDNSVVPLTYMRTRH